MLKRLCGATVYGLHQRRRGRGQQVPHLEHRGRVARVLHQVEQLEPAVRGALGQEPRRPRLRDARLGVAPVAGGIPGHRPVGEDRLVGRDYGRELGVREPQRLRVERHPLVPPERHRRRHLRDRRRLLEAHRGGRRRARRIQQRHLRVEEGAGRALGEVAREGAPDRHEGEVDAIPGEARHRLIDRRHTPRGAGGRHGVRPAGRQAGKREPPVAVGHGRAGLRAGQRHRDPRHPRPVQVSHLPADREGRSLCPRGGRTQQPQPNDQGRVPHPRRHTPPPARRRHAHARRPLLPRRRPAMSLAHAAGSPPIHGHAGHLLTSGQPPAARPTLDRFD